MPAQRIAETTINARLHDILCSMHPRWQESHTGGAELTHVIRGEPASQPDVVIAPPASAPVVVECKIDTAGNVEEKARSRIGKALHADGRLIEAALCVIYPKSLSYSPVQSLDQRLRHTNELKWAIWTGVGGEPETRFPSTGWGVGSVSDIAGIIESMAVSNSAVAAAAEVLANALGDAASLMKQTSTRKVAAILRQEDGEQTCRMAAAMIANAFVFQTTVSGTFDTLTIDEIREGSADRGTLYKRDVLDCWEEILKINYWPVFSVAKEVLLVLSDEFAPKILDLLAKAAQTLADGGLATVQDVAGQTFGTLITDRKFLAAFYTLPSSSALLAELAVSHLDVDWSNEDDLANLRVADLACGTGALLSAAYRRIASRIRRAGLDDKALHETFMSEVLIGCDIMPSAAHLTTTMLSSAHPEVVYDRCGIHVVPYGDREGRVLLGSLELSSGSGGTQSLFGGYGRALAATESAVVEGETVFNVADGSLDLVIMNPPFTRSTGHEGERVETVPVPAFAGLSNNETDQRKMANRLKQISASKQAAHGNAGLASHFLDLAHSKLRPGGVLGFVLPYTFVSGSAWRSARRFLNDNYSAVTVVSIASDESTGRAFSADTHMAEVLIIATKSPPPNTMAKPPAAEVVWTSLIERPVRIVDAVVVAQAVSRALHNSVLMSTERIMLGDDHIATAICSTVDHGGAAAVRSSEVASAAIALAAGRLELPRVQDAAVPVTALGDLGERGPYHLDIRHYPNNRDSGSRRAPFEVYEITEGDPTPAYPLLWSHDSRSGRESTLILQHDKCGTPRTGMRDHALRVWGTATRLHYNRDFRLNSQPLAAGISEDRCLGGRAWPSWITADASWEKPLALWANTTLGLIGWWWTATRQQQGRAIISITLLGELPVLDCRSLSGDQLARADDVFERVRTLSLLPANEAWRDPSREILDREVLCSWLELHETVGTTENELLDSLRVLRTQWCEEPSVHGGKDTRPSQ